MQSSRPPRLLFVDDNRLVVEMVRDAFVAAEFDVDSAGDGVEGLRRARERAPDVIVSDIIMPEMDGWEFFRSVRSDPDLREVPFVFLSSEREAAQRVRGLRLGAEDYITKPFSTEELVLRVRLVLERHGGGPPSASPVLSGDTSHLPLLDLLQLLSTNGKTGCLRIATDEQGEGRIALREGEIVGAAAPSASGRKALFRMLRWGEARFAFAPDPVDEGPALEGGTSRLLMDGLVERDDLERLEAQGPAEGARFRLRPESRDEVKREGLSPAEFEVLKGVRKERTLREILDHASRTDGEIRRALNELMERGIVELLSSGGEPGDGGAED